jgi:hypothetical protein
MSPKCLSQRITLTLIIFLVFFLGGCSYGEFSDSEMEDWSHRLLSWESNSSYANSGNLKPGTYPIDILFTDFYQALGGESTLGPAISVASTSERLTKQYTEAGLMLFDPQAPKSSRFSLAPIGINLGINNGKLLGKTNHTGRNINGHLVLAEFLVEYERLGGARFVGKPISGAQYNADKKRIEQYFENIGFYKLDSETKIRLMPYGVYACDRNCRNQEPLAGIPIIQPILTDPFIKKTIDLGLPFVGKPLTGMHLTPDGKQEVIFENLVLVANMESPEEVHLRPIAERIGTYVHKPAQAEESSVKVFYEVADGLGYNVPLYFVEYLELYGGEQVSGYPISEVFSPEPGTFQQCFTNLCLQFNLNAEGEQRLQPVPLGAEYKAKDYDTVVDFETSQAMENLEMKVWEEAPFVSANDSQEIIVALYEDRQPLENYEPILFVTMADGSQRTAYFQPSDANGHTSIRLAPIDAPNGTLIAYKVCFFGVIGEPHCVGDNYLIWDSD